MPKYEIMLIVDPKSLTEVEEFTKSIFKTSLKSYEKLEKTELAYEINKAKIANYILMNVETNGVEIKEFIRRSDILKSVWRRLIINLDSERAIKTLSKMRPINFDEMPPRGNFFNRRSDRDGGYSRYRPSDTTRHERAFVAPNETKSSSSLQKTNNDESESKLRSVNGDE